MSATMRGRLTRDQSSVRSRSACHSVTLRSASGRLSAEGIAVPSTRRGIRIAPASSADSISQRHGIVRIVDAQTPVGMAYAEKGGRDEQQHDRTMVDGT